MAETVANKNRRIRQDALREQLSKGKHVDHVIEIARKLSEPNAALEATDIQRYKAAADIKLKLINKYLSDVKQADIEITGADGKDLFPESIKIIYD